jgi:uncharacterized protein (TIGR02300 family)
LNKVAKPELGTKRLCGSCGAKFYDLGKDPIVCPKCDTVFQVVVPVSRSRPDAAGRAAAAAGAAAAAAAAKRPQPTEVAEQEEGAEFVSLEDADAEEQGKQGKKSEGDLPDTDDIEVEEDESMDDAAFIQEDEEDGDPDVTDIVGDGHTKEDDT